jgi:NodT family efflux transporter outer membrane factor (OMF) lipoprotein
MKNIGFIAIVCSVFFSSCKMEKIMTVNEKVDVPSAWLQPAKSADTTNTAKIQWRIFYKDSLLRNIIAEAITNNPDMEIAMQRVLRNRVELVAQKNAIAPEIAATAGAGAVRFGEYTVDGVGNFDTNLSENVDAARQIPDPVPDYLLGVQTTWEAGLWGRYKNRKAKAKAQLLAGEEGRRWVQTMLVEDVANSYYRILAFDAEIKAIEQNIELQTTAVEIIRLQKEAGRVNELGVKQFEAQLLDFRAMLATKKVELAEEEFRLNAMLGRTQGTLIRQSTFDASNLPEMRGFSTPNTILKNRMDIREVIYFKDAAMADMKIAEAGYLPDLRWTGFFGINSFNPDFFFNLPVSMAYTMIGSLAAPVVNRNTIKRNYRQSVADFNVAHLEYKKKLLTAVAEINTEIRRLEGFAEITEVRGQQREVMTQGVEISNELFASGFASYVEVLLMQSNRLQAEIEYIEALKNQYQSSIGLYKAMGGGADGL